MARGTMGQCGPWQPRLKPSSSSMLLDKLSRHEHKSCDQHIIRTQLQLKIPVSKHKLFSYQGLHLQAPFPWAWFPLAGHQTLCHGSQLGTSISKLPNPHCDLKLPNPAL